MEEEREGQGGQQVGLAEAQRRQAEEVPELAEAETYRGHQEDGQIGAAAVGEEGEAELGNDEDQKHGDDQAGRDERQLEVVTG